MRLVLLSRQHHLHSVRRLRESARQRGHTLRVIDPLECTLSIGPSPTTTHSVENRAGTPRFRIYHDGREVRGTDCVIPRISAALAGHGVAVVSQFEAMGVPVVNGSRAISCARDKLQTLQLLSRHDIDVPVTVLSHGPGTLDAALEIVGGPPVVLKLLQGTQGIGVILAETRVAVAATLETLWGLGQQILIQEFVSESRGRDIRALVVGGRIVGAMRRVAEAGEWRANLHRGGFGEQIHLEDAYGRMATEAARVVGLDVAGVDLLEGRNGPRVMEINASPGFEGLERVTGVDAAAAILASAEAVAEAAPGGVSAAR